MIIYIQINIIKHLIQQGFKNIQLITLLSYAHKLSENTQKALQILEQQPNHNNYHPTIQILKAQYMIELGNKNQAKQQYQLATNGINNNYNEISQNENERRQQSLVTALHGNLTSILSNEIPPLYPLKQWEQLFNNSKIKVCYPSRICELINKINNITKRYKENKVKIFQVYSQYKSVYKQCINNEQYIDTQQIYFIKFAEIVKKFMSYLIFQMKNIQKR